MPGSARVGNAEEGVEFVWLTSPKSFIGEKTVKAVEVNKWGTEPDSSGRRRQKLKDQNLNSRLVIKSLGFDPENT